MEFHIHNSRSITLTEAWQITRRIFTIEGGLSSQYNVEQVRKRSVSPGARKPEIKVPNLERFNSEEELEDMKKYYKIAAKNAAELIREEEEAKLRAERKKAKKERQKQKKLNSNPNLKNNDESVENVCNDINNISMNSESAESEEIDTNAAFVSKAVKKAKNPVELLKPQGDKKSKKIIKNIDSIVQRGLDCEKKENYKEAVQLLSEAIDLAPKRIDILLKRSLIYYKAAKFQKSINDAKKVLQLSSNNIEAYYRLGEAHFALNNLTEAEEVFKILLNFNSHSDYANKRLFSIHVKQLVDIGFNPNDAFTALLKSKNKTLDEAIDYLTSKDDSKEEVHKEVQNVSDELYYSDEDESEESCEEDSEEDDDDVVAQEQTKVPAAAAVPKPVIMINKHSPMLKDSSNPFGCCSLFVGNLKKGITYDEVHSVFIKFGPIVSIKLTTEPSCYAFVNYVESEAAGSAMEALQGSRWFLSTEPLVIKYPSRVLSQAIPSIKNVEPSNLEVQSTPAESVQEKCPRPPPKTEECFYWRTYGCCKYGGKCFNLHIPLHKGIALRNNRHYIGPVAKSTKSQ